jgi:hypothetical protein
VDPHEERGNEGNLHARNLISICEWTIKHQIGRSREQEKNKLPASANAEGASGVVPAWKQRFAKWHHLTNMC